VDFCGFLWISVDLEWISVDLGPILVGFRRPQLMKHLFAGEFGGLGRISVDGPSVDPCFTQLNLVRSHCPDRSHERLSKGNASHNV
jgi:hypothetical protein